VAGLATWKELGRCREIAWKIKETEPGITNSIESVYFCYMESILMTADLQYTILNNDPIPGKCLCLKSEWKPEFAKLFESIEGLNAIRISRSNGFKNTDCLFLTEIPKPLLSIEIYTNEITDLSPLFLRNEVAYLGIQSGSKQSLDISIFPNLKQLFLHCPQKQKFTKLPPSLVCCNFVNIPYANLEFLAGAIELETLKITGRKLTALDGLNQCRSIKSIDLFSAPNLNDIEALSLCKTLTNVEVDSCKGINKLTSIETLTELRSLSIDNCGAIDSLNSVLSCTKLQHVSFIEDTFIIDGKIRQLLKLPCLNSIRFANRKHYDATVADFR
jgi:hypothetical protein